MRQQLTAASTGVKTRVDQLQTASGVKDKVAQYWIEKLISKARSLQSENPVRSQDDISKEVLAWLDSQTDQPYNPLLDVPCMFFALLWRAIPDLNLQVLDPSQDTLVEILHTISLGVEKYAWHGLHSEWTQSQQDLFVVRLQATDIDGLNVPPIRAAYIMQYRNGLIGKHFKTLMQTAAFHIYDLTSRAQFNLIKALGELGALLWMSSIEDMDRYLVRCQAQCV